MRKRALLVAAGLAILGLITGLSLHGPAKEKNMDSRERRAKAGEPASAGRHFEIALPERIETATFAMG